MRLSKFNFPFLRLREQLLYLTDKEAAEQKYQEKFIAESFNRTRALAEKVNRNPQEARTTTQFLSQHRALEASINQLTDDLQLPLKMFRDGYGYKEIANTLQTDVKTVKKRIKKAIEEIRRFSA